MSTQTQDSQEDQDPEDRRGNKPSISDRLFKWCCLLVALFLIFIPTGLLKQLEEESRRKPTTRSIGQLIHVAPGAAFGRFALVETDIGFYPLAAYLTAAKGTPLVMEERAWDERYVCDAAKTLCVPTAPDGFELPKTGAKP